MAEKVGNDLKWATYFGSQWAMVKLKLIRVTNISVSSRISCTDGGGRAMANATIPSSGGFDFRVCEKVYCVLSRHNINTTCMGTGQNRRRTLILLHRNDELLQTIFG